MTYGRMDSVVLTLNAPGDIKIYKLLVVCIFIVTLHNDANNNVTYILMK